ncbi:MULTISPECIES: hypothetical protein [Methylobacteriaceae]|uniref:DUF4158 domain-containing protein n=2 Tax=Methylobacterium TaxID=407 RepID=A0A512J1H4_9HYPH|nr:MULTISPECIES: hypothetical protein [Methylobacterium]MBY0295128.1 hypothetical protein [Methylobacterium sp.]MDN3621767.1 hypothetical protein [Methylobacterium isbiliense]GEP03795.1 hypothetical protein MOX02_18330 [Methylobacterium oxalidis]GJD98955.1 hypothetical protein GMJLKIPL_0868 [Methylobacterium isbiliense]GJE33152.1 hypothetical protein LDDCCGHA_3351 [Methylobacterium oxalidis]
MFANELGRLAGREKRHGTARTVTYLLLKNGLRPVCSTPEFERFLFERPEAEALIRRIGLP